MSVISGKFDKGLISDTKIVPTTQRTGIVSGIKPKVEQVGLDVDESSLSSSQQVAYQKIRNVLNEYKSKFKSKTTRGYYSTVNYYSLGKLLTDGKLSKQDLLDAGLTNKQVLNSKMFVYCQVMGKPTKSGDINFRRSSIGRALEKGQLTEQELLDGGYTQDQIKDFKANWKVWKKYYSRYENSQIDKQAKLASEMELAKVKSGETLAKTKKEEPTIKPIVIATAPTTNEVLVRDSDGNEYWKFGTESQVKEATEAIEKGEKYDKDYEPPEGISYDQNQAGEIAKQNEDGTLEVYTWRGDTVTVSLDKYKELVNLSGKQQFDGMIANKIIPEGSKFLEKEGGWSYIPEPTYSNLTEEDKNIIDTQGIDALLKKRQKETQYQEALKYDNIAYDYETGKIYDVTNPSKPIDISPEIIPIFEMKGDKMVFNSNNSLGANLNEKYKEQLELQQELLPKFNKIKEKFPELDEKLKSYDFDYIMQVQKSGVSNYDLNQYQQSIATDPLTRLYFTIANDSIDKQIQLGFITKDQTPIIKILDIGDKFDPNNRESDPKNDSTIGAWFGNDNKGSPDNLVIIRYSSKDNRSSNPNYLTGVILHELAHASDDKRISKQIEDGVYKQSIDVKNKYDIVDKNRDINDIVWIIDGVYDPTISANSSSTDKKFIGKNVELRPNAISTKEDTLNTAMEYARNEFRTAYELAVQGYDRDTVAQSFASASDGAWNNQGLTKEQLLKVQELARKDVGYNGEDFKLIFTPYDVPIVKEFDNQFIKEGFTLPESRNASISVEDYGDVYTISKNNPITDYYEKYKILDKYEDKIILDKTKDIQTILAKEGFFKVAKQQEDIKKQEKQSKDFESNYINLGKDKFTGKDQYMQLESEKDSQGNIIVLGWNDLPEKYQSIALKEGYDAMQKTIESDNKENEVKIKDQQDATAKLELYKFVEEGPFIQPDGSVQVGQVTYDIAKYLRDNPYDESTLIKAGFTQSSIDSAKQYNKDTRGIGAPDYEDLKTFRENYFKEKGWKYGVESDVSGDEYDKRLQEATQVHSDLYRPKVSQDEFINNYLTDNKIEKTVDDLKSRKQLEGENNEYYYKRLIEQDNLLRKGTDEYIKKYGVGAVIESGVSKVGVLAFAPMRAYAPEVSIKDITPEEWVIGGVQVVLTLFGNQILGSGVKAVSDIVSSKSMLNVAKKAGLAQKYMQEALATKGAVEGFPSGHSEIQSAIQASKVADDKFIKQLSSLDNVPTKDLIKYEKASNYKGLKDAVDGVQSARQELKDVWDIENKYKYGSAEYSKEFLPQLQLARNNLDRALKKLNSVLVNRVPEVAPIVSKIEPKPIQSTMDFFTKSEVTVPKTIDGKIVGSSKVERWTYNNQALDMTNKEQLDKLFPQLKVGRPKITDTQISPEPLRPTEQISTPKSALSEGITVKSDKPMGYTGLRSGELGGAIKPFYEKQSGDIFSGGVKTPYSPEEGIGLSKGGGKEIVVTPKPSGSLSTELIRAQTETDAIARDIFAGKAGTAKTTGWLAYKGGLSVSALSYLSPESKVELSQIIANTTSVLPQVQVISADVTDYISKVNALIQMQVEAINSTEIQNEINPLVGTITKNLIETQPITDVNAQLANQVKNLTKTDVESKTKTTTELKSATELATEIEPIASTEIKPQTKVDTSTKTEVKPLILPQTKIKLDEKVTTKISLPSFDSSIPDEAIDKSTGKLFRGIIEWKQGALWRYIVPPYGKDDFHATKNPLPGTYKFSSGKGSSYRTLQVINGKLDRDVDVDLGWAKIHIKKGKGEDLEIRYLEGEKANVDKRLPVGGGVYSSYVDNPEEIKTKATYKQEEELQPTNLQAFDGFEEVGLRPEGIPDVITERIPKGMPIKKEFPPELKKTELPQYRSGRLKVYTIDAEWLRNQNLPMGEYEDGSLRTSVDFGGGGHSEVFPLLIPKNEIWIDRKFGIIDAKAYLLHELREYRAMRDEGLDYEESHSNRANPLEVKARKNISELDDMINEELSYHSKRNLIKPIQQPKREKWVNPIEEDEPTVERNSYRPKKVKVQQSTYINQPTYLGHKILSPNMGTISI